MHPDRDEIAALNNAAWCAAVWRSHGLPVEQAAGLWFCRGRTPLFYPNVVTVERGADPGAQVALIGDLCRSGSDPDFSIKDSFSVLDPRAMGLTPLFETRWLWRDPDGTADPGAPGWRRIVDPLGLDAWEVAWRGGDRAGQRIFLPGLLSDAHIAILAGFDARGEIRAGAIAHEAAGAVAIGNVFGLYGAAIEAVSALFPGHPLVGYERGDALESALGHGFKALGPLRVSVKSGDALTPAPDRPGPWGESVAVGGTPAFRR